MQESIGRYAVGLLVSCLELCSSDACDACWGSFRLGRGSIWGARETWCHLCFERLMEWNRVHGRYCHGVGRFMVLGGVQGERF